MILIIQQLSTLKDPPLSERAPVKRKDLSDTTGAKIDYLARTVPKLRVKFYFIFLILT